MTGRSPPQEANRDNRDSYRSSHVPGYGMSAPSCGPVPLSSRPDGVVGNMVDAAVLAERLAELERRVQRLEHGDTAAMQRPAGADEHDRTDVFWTLNGLKARLGTGAGGVVFAGALPLPTGEEYVWQYGRDTDVLLASDWSQLSQVIAALGHPIRLLLLQRVLTGTRSTAELQIDDRLGTSGQLYHHLRQLLLAAVEH
jgi:hypothetical protein